MEEAIGRNCRFLQGKDRDQPALQELRAALREGRGCRVVVRNYRKDGTLFWQEPSISPVRDEHGRLTHFVGVQDDVTERKFPTNYTHQQVGTMIGANREAVTRAFGLLRGLGAVEVQHRLVRVPEPDALKRAATTGWRAATRCARSPSSGRRGRGAAACGPAPRARR